MQLFQLWYGNKRMNQKFKYQVKNVLNFQNPRSNFRVTTNLYVPVVQYETVSQMNIPI